MITEPCHPSRSGDRCLYNACNRAGACQHITHHVVVDAAAYAAGFRFGLKAAARARELARDMVDSGFAAKHAGPVAPADDGEAAIARERRLIADAEGYDAT